MCPLTPPTLTRLDPRYPPLWRDAHTVQFGLEGRVRLDVDEDWIEPFLARLRLGIRVGRFEAIAHETGASHAAARRLRESIGPLLVEDAPPPPAVRLVTHSLSDPRAPERLRAALDDEGVAVTTDDAEDAVVVVLIEGAASALQCAPFLQADIPHLPVAFEKEGVVIGPLVVPGHSPCLTCRDEGERARDAAWPVLHAQLVGRPAGPIAAGQVAQAAMLTAALLRRTPSGVGLSVRLTADGRRAWRTVRHHAECRCREMSSRSPRGNARPIAPLVPLTATTRSPAFARPA